MAKKKASKKVEKTKKEVVDDELIDLEDYEDELDEEFLEDEEFETKKKVKKAPKKEVEETEEPLTLEDRVISMENKLNAVIVLLVIVTIVAIITMFVAIFKDGGSSKSSKSNTNTNTQEEDTTQNYEYDVSKFKEISAKDIENESKGKTILLYIGRSTCGYCVQFVPILQEVQDKHSYTTYYLDIAKIYDYQNGVVLDSASESVMKGLKTNDAQKGVMDNFGSTPMTLVIKNGKVVDSIIGYVDAGTLESLVSSNGLE